MSLPRDILDQLLSGYLDDALGNDQRTQLEQLLRENAEVARELEELRALRSTLREIHTADQQQFQLQPNFADRVLKAAVDQAATEGLGEDHAVMMLAQQPSTSVAPRRTIPWAKIAGAVVAIAASVIVAISVLWTPDEDPDLGAMAGDPQIKPAPVDVTPSDTPDVVDPGPKLVDADPDPGTTPDKIVQTPEVTPKNPEIVPQDPQVAPIDPKLDIDALQLGLVMVLNVRQSDPNAVANAMKAAGLNAAEEKPIDKETVGFEGNADADEDYSVLYIQSTAKKIDNFINLVYFDLKGIKSVGFSHALDAPIAKVGSKLDPTKVRHGSWELKDDAGDSVNVLANRLAELTKLEVDAERRKAGLPKPKKADKNADFPSQIFVLVH